MDPIELDVPALTTQLQDVYKNLLDQGARLAEMSQHPADKRDDVFALELRTTRENVSLMDSRSIVLQRLIDAKQAEERAKARPQGQGPEAATMQVGGGHDRRSAGQQFIESDAYRGWARPDFRESGALPRGFAESEVRTLITGPGDLGAGTYGTEGGAFIPIMPFAIAPQAVRRDRLVVRDLLPVTTTTYPVIHYIEETYVSGSDAAMVAEGAAKPEVVMNWAAKQGVVQKVAAWIPVTMEALQDGPQLRGAIDNRLGYKLRRQEENQLLNGDGTAPNLRGLLNATNIQTQPKQTDTFTTFTLGLAKLELHDGDASGAVMNPSDYWAQIAASASTLTGASPFQGPPGTLWGYPVVRTPRIAAGTALLGDFNQGAEIFDRESMTVRVGDQHSDYFTNNKVAILAEQREVLVIYRGDLFCTLTGL